MKNSMDPKELGEQYLLDIMRNDDPKFLRTMILEMMVLSGTLYRRIQVHMFLHPLFFLAGFLTCYFLS
jgi:hypothetical protein